MFIMLCYNRCYVHLVIQKIGFVLHNKGWICRGLFTNVERWVFG